MPLLSDFGRKINGYHNSQHCIRFGKTKCCIWKELSCHYYSKPFEQGWDEKLRSVADILNAISDDKSLLLFNTIAITNGETEIQVRKMGLTLKQYYLRMAKLTKADLIRRKNGRYFLTLMGKIVYEAHMTIGKALNYYWKLQALESIQTSSPDGLPKKEISKLVDTLIDDYQIKDILMKTPHSTEDQKSRDSTPQIITGAKEKMRLEKLVSYR